MKAHYDSNISLSSAFTLIKFHKLFLVSSTGAVWCEGINHPIVVSDHRGLYECPKKASINADEPKLKLIIASDDREVL